MPEVQYLDIALQHMQSALSQMEHIAAIGIEAAAFTADDIATHCRAPEWFAFNAGLPTWTDEIDFNFLPASQ